MKKKILLLACMVFAITYAYAQSTGFSIESTYDCVINAQVEVTVNLGSTSETWTFNQELDLKANRPYTVHGSIIKMGMLSMEVSPKDVSFRFRTYYSDTSGSGPTSFAYPDWNSNPHVAFYTSYSRTSTGLNVRLSHSLRQY